jgi:hypothetical protein
VGEYFLVEDTGSSGHLLVASFTQLLIGSENRFFRVEEATINKENF